MSGSPLAVSLVSGRGEPVARLWAFPGSVHGEHSPVPFVVSIPRFRSWWARRTTALTSKPYLWRNTVLRQAQDERMKMAASLESANYPRNDFDW